MPSKKSQYIRFLLMVVFLLLTLWALYQKSPQRNQGKQVYKNKNQIMGTMFSIVIAENFENKKIDGIAQEAVAEIHRLDRKFSTYKPTSLLSKINQNAGKTAILVDDETIKIFKFAEKISKQSEGIFDVTFKSFGRVWNLNPAKFQIPDPTFIQKRRKYINYKNIEIDLVKKTIFLKESYTKVGLGAFVKGYAVDQAAKILQQSGIKNFLVNGGGDIYFSGNKFGKAWVAGIQHPRKKFGNFLTYFPVKGHGAIVTSGDYERFILKDGKRFHHIIDPRTGYPSKGVQSVTIWAPNTMLADALATTVFILGRKKGLKLLQNYPQTKVLLVDEFGKHYGDSQFFQIKK
ncbi:MAG: thiamine biosynthesis lipoprotein [bacterium]|jgi:thiamine biosynthesis lipoprotein